MEAQHTKLAVSASSQYATNAKYVEVNSGRHPRVRVFSGLFLFIHSLNSIHILQPASHVHHDDDGANFSSTSFVEALHGE